MKKSIIRHLYVIIILSQSCVTVYQSTPVSLNEAQNQGRVKLISTIDQTLYYKNIERTKSGYIGTTIKKTEVHFDSSQIKYVFLEDFGETGLNIISGEFLGNFYAGFGVKYEREIPLTNAVAVIPKVGLGMNIMMGFGPPVAFAGASFAFGNKRSKIAIGGSYLAVHNLPIIDLEFRYYGKRGSFYSGGVYYSLEDNIFLPSIAIGKKF